MMKINGNSDQVIEILVECCGSDSFSSPKIQAEREEVYQIREESRQEGCNGITIVRRGDARDDAEDRAQRRKDACYEGTMTSTLV
jgi:hypothetical protein